jgi:hypothetical protein
MMMIAAGLLAGCAGGAEVGEPPPLVSYEDWARELARIPEIIEAGKFCEAGLERHRNAQIMDNRFDIYEELSMGILLFMQSADQLYRAWDKYPSYEQFILLELDKVYDYMHACVMRRPHYIDPTDPLNIYGGPLTFEQRQKMAEYRRKLAKWEEATSSR